MTRQEELAAARAALHDLMTGTRTRHWSACRWIRSSSAASR
ncbi:hypothetical protein IH683_04290 [Escherichia coli]|nr:hypothetical protein [Escherichia coli]